MAERLPVFPRLEELLPHDVMLRVLPELLEIEATLERKNNILKLVQENLEDIRLNLKYIQFDLDSTRRERDQYKTELEKYRG